jgi:hypothetical protein
VHVALSYIPALVLGAHRQAGIVAGAGLIQSSYVAGTGYASVLYPGNDSDPWAAYGGRPARHSAVH